jgi:hypothetical protein
MIEHGKEYYDEINNGRNHIKNIKKLCAMILSMECVDLVLHDDVLSDLYKEIGFFEKSSKRSKAIYTKDVVKHVKQKPKEE